MYSDNGLVDAWLLADRIVGSTQSLCPLVAVQPIYMHPYTAAKMVATIGHLHGRRLYLNVIAGGFRNDLLALDDPTPHDERYDRATEYTLLVRDLLARDAVTFEGAYYTVRNLSMSPGLAADLQPRAPLLGLLFSGSSPAGLAAARRVGATAVRYPKPTGEEDSFVDDDMPYGVRVGIIARDTAEEAWSIAHERFPPDRKGQLAHGLAMKVSDSHWHRTLSSTDSGPGEGDDPYWLEPFNNYGTFCPYLVGDHARVSRELRAYWDLGFTTFILDIPRSPDDLEHAAVAFTHALNGSGVEQRAS